MQAPARAAAPVPHSVMLAEVLEGLSRSQKTLPCKFLYDAEGSRLFDRICTLPEYYPTGTETAILQANASRLAAWVPPGAVLVELGSGSSTKTRILLDALPHLRGYAPVDISAVHLDAAAARIALDYPRLPVHPVVADFTADLALPAELRRMPLALFFPGSTIGNFEPDEASALLRGLRALPRACLLVIGADLRKDVSRLIAAYDDAAGVTADFNLNLLARLNRELGAGFDVDTFRHEARWNEAAGRIEMHLVSRRAQLVQIAGHAFSFDEGETIHTENSHKFTVDGFQELAAGAGWSSRAFYCDPELLFSVHVLAPRP
jgi:L-histidine Nalpha-methyltransferase